MTQDFRFPSFPRKRESSKPLKKLDTRFHGYDDQSFQRKSCDQNFHRITMCYACHL